MTKQIINNSLPAELLEKTELRRLISEKEKQLIAILEKVEQLKIDLSVLRQEYNIKIGRLYIRLDEIDLGILIFKKIEDLLDKGFAFSEAQRIVLETLDKKREQIKDDYHKLDEEEKDLENQKQVTDDERNELKKLWRKLARKYHPDLSEGNEELMKKINKAYANGDLDTLRSIDREQSGGEIETTSIEDLKRKLITLEESIEKTGYEFQILNKSEWAILKKSIENATKQKRDLLNELSEKLLLDIAKKENQLQQLKKKYGQE